jgi:hypothetical protein
MPPADDLKNNHREKRLSPIDSYGSMTDSHFIPLRKIGKNDMSIQVQSTIWS